MARKTRKKIYFLTLLALAVVGGIIAFLVLRGDGEEMPGLFADVPEASAPADFIGKKIAKRHRWVRLNPAGWDNLLEVGNRFRLNLFPDLDLMALVAQHQTQPHGDQAVMAVVESQPMDSLVVLGRSGDLMNGRITLADGRQFEINNVNGGLYVILEVDPRKVGKCGVCESPSQAAAPKERKTSSTGDAAAFARLVARANTPARCAACGLEQPLPGHIPPTQVTAVPGDAPLPLPAPPRVASREEISRARLVPILAALRVPPAMLAANRWRVHTSQGSSTRPNTMPPDVLERFRVLTNVKDIDVLFLYTAAITDTTAVIQTRVNTMLVEANQYLNESRIPVRLRQVTQGNTKLWKANHRAMMAMGDGVRTDPNLLAGGYPKDGPAWAINPADNTFTRPDYRPLVGDAQTRWRSTISLWPKAKAASYQPLFVDAQKGSLNSYMQWLTNRSNSLMFGDQYWAPGKFYVGYEMTGIEANMTDIFDATDGVPALGNGTSLPDGWPVYFIGDVPDLTHTKAGWGSRPINLDSILYYREISSGGGGAVGGVGAGVTPPFPCIPPSRTP